MLQKIALLDSQVIRALLVAIMGVLGLVLSWFGVDEKIFSAEATKLIDAVSLLITTGGVVYAAYARAMKPTPPLTESAAEQTRTLVSQQAGAKMQSGAASRSNVANLVLAGLALVMMLGMTGCAAFTKPQSFDDRLAYAYGVHTAVQTAAANSVNAKELSSAQGEQVLKLADDSRRILDAASVAIDAGDIRTAEGQLALATNILTQLQTYLRRPSP